jgi:hypothetical protein
LPTKARIKPRSSDSLVLVETPVLRREEGFLHVLGDVGEHDPDAALVLLEHLGEAFALAVEHDARTRQLDALEPGVIGQIGGCLVVEVDHVAEVDRGRRDLLVLAELPILRLHRIRSGGYLAERQRRGEDLGEERFHLLTPLFARVCMFRSPRLGSGVIQAGAFCSDKAHPRVPISQLSVSSNTPF